MNLISAPIVRNYTPGRPYNPKGIAIHTYNGKGRNLQNWFNNVIAQVSATASVVDTGDIYVYLDDMDIAWANGTWQANLDYLAMEHWDNGVPSDAVRTNDLYEATAQWIASKYLKFGWDINNMNLIEEHRHFVSTGCPGALDVQRIKNRVFEILHPLPVIPAWKQNAQDIGAVNFTTEKEVSLVNFLTGEVIKTFSKGTVIGVRYLTQGYYVTESSFLGERPTGFKKEDLEYKEPKPDVILFLVSVATQPDISFETIEQAREYYEAAKALLLPGEGIVLTQFNITKGEKLEVDYFKKPIPEPDPVDPEPVEPTKPDQNGVRWLWNTIFNFLKSIYEKIRR